MRPNDCIRVRKTRTSTPVHYDSRYKTLIPGSNWPFVSIASSSICPHLHNPATMSARLALRASARVSRLPPQSRPLSSKPDPSKTTFRGQLYDSTARRVQAEKAQTEARLLAGKATGARASTSSSATLGGLFGFASLTSHLWGRSANQ
jgi:hypothetical protein